MTRVLFSNAYFYKLDKKQWRFKQPYPPLGTLQAAAAIRQGGFQVSLFDANLKANPREIEFELEQVQPRYLIIYDDGFNYLTKMCLTAMRDAAFVLIGEGKRKACTVIVSSSDSTDHHELYLAAGADYIIRGEAEETLIELLRLLEQEENNPAIDGLAFVRDGKTVVTGARPVLRNLDALPLPAWDLVDMSAYERIWKRRHGYFSLNVATTRGCPYKCNWCAKPIYGNRYNIRSPEHVVTEIEMLLHRYGPAHLWMCDDIFGLKPGWVHRFRDLVRERSLKFRFTIQSRADLLADKDTAVALVEAGLDTVWIGAESGSQHVLDAMEKGITVEQIHEATHKVRQLGARVAFFLQFGYPGETKEDMEKTLKLVTDLMPDQIGISVSYPLPGTRFHEKVKAGMTEKKNWVDSDDLEMMYANPYPPKYYKILQRYVHNRYRIQRGVRQMRTLFDLRGPVRSKLRNMASMLYNIPPYIVRAWQLNQLSHASSR